MSDQTLYRRSTEFPFDDKETLWDAFRIAAAFEWAKGRPPSAEAIADAMVKVLVPVEPDCEAAIVALLSPATMKAIGMLPLSYDQAKAVVVAVMVSAGIGTDDE